jgi:hypothetical protein
MGVGVGVDEGSMVLVGVLVGGSVGEEVSVGVDVLSTTATASCVGVGVAWGDDHIPEPKTTPETSSTSNPITPSH